MGLSVKGTLGILLTAVLAGLITQQTALDDIQKLTKSGIRISPKLQEWFREQIETL